MKKPYSKENKKTIVEEAIQVGNIAETALKYDIHKSTLYDWINNYKNNDTKKKWIHIRVSDEEKEILKKRAEALGYKKDVSTLIRKVLFSRDILIGDPKLYLKEFNGTKAEINKIGSNVNQIANYTNFLANKNYVETEFLQDLIKATDELKALCLEQRDIINKSIRKVYK